MKGYHEVGLVGAEHQPLGWTVQSEDPVGGSHSRSREGLFTINLHFFMS